jgi:prepilin-type processing-associated H-X9-DG protein
MIKKKDSIQCPSNSNGVKDSEVLTSYIYKPAIDRAWFGSLLPSDPGKKDASHKLIRFRRILDFKYPWDQMVFFDRVGWHWGQSKEGWRDGVRLNAAFLDGHVRNVRMLNTVGREAPDNVGEFSYTISEPGEPMWYNYDKTSNTGKRAVLFDPRRYYDKLP